MRSQACPTYLAVVKRSVYLALALFGERADGTSEVLAVQLGRLGPNGSSVIDCLRAFATNYGVTCAVVETDSILLDAAAEVGLRAVPITLAQAKQCLTGSTSPDWQTFFQTVLVRDPRLKRLVTFLRDSSNIELTDRWRLAQLLAVALGFTYAETMTSHQGASSFIP